MKSRGNLMAPMPGQVMPNSPGTAVMILHSIGKVFAIPNASIGRVHRTAHFERTDLLPKILKTSEQEVNPVIACRYVIDRT